MEDGKDNGEGSLSKGAGLSNTFSLSPLFLLVLIVGMLPSKQFLRTYYVCPTPSYLFSEPQECAEGSSYRFIRDFTASNCLILAHTGS